VGQTSKDFASAAWTRGERERQEDIFHLARLSSRDGENPCILLIVADGMGGQFAGDVASRTASDAFAEAANSYGALDAQELLRDSLDDANDALRRKLEQDDALEGMGTTIVAVLIDGATAHWISVGDSILYLLRGSRLKRLNADHSLAGLYAEQVAKGELSQAEADERGGHNQLRSALMGGHLKLIDRSDKHSAISLKTGDVLLLATDGLLTLANNRIEAIANQHRASAGNLADALIEEIRNVKAPYQDNTTVVAYVHELTGASQRRFAIFNRSTKAWLGIAALVLALGAAGALAWLYPNLPKQKTVEASQELPKTASSTKSADEAATTPNQ